MSLENGVQLGDNPKTNGDSGITTQWCGFRAFFNQRTPGVNLGLGQVAFLSLLYVNTKTVLLKESVLYLYKTLVNRASNPMTLSAPHSCLRVRVFVIGFGFIQ